MSSPASPSESPAARPAAGGASPPVGRLGDAEVERLRDSLDGAGYTVDGVREVLGPTAGAALGRDQVVPALRATEGGSDLETLIRLFLLQQPVARESAASALPLDDLLAAGLLDAGSGSAVTAAADLRPYAADGDRSDDGPGWWVVSDLGSGLRGADRRVLAPDHVLGVGGASTTLAQLTVRDPVGSALDVGTGCGVQALHLAGHAGRVTATDLNPRALQLAELTLRLSGADAELLEGSLLDPVAGRRFDLVVANPPFVVSPAARYTYRDSGLPGDELGRRLVAGLPGVLAEGGVAQLLANWLHVRGEDWVERVASWVEPTGCDAWVVQREVQDPAEYAELWLRDGGDDELPPAEYARRYDEWLSAFDAQRADGVGFGWIVLRRSDAVQPAVAVEDWPHPVEQPLGPAVAGWLARQDALRRAGAATPAATLAVTRDDPLLRVRLRCAPDVVQEQHGEPGAEDPGRVVLRQQTGLRRAVEVSTATAAVVGACDGSLPLGVLVDAVAAVLGDDPAQLRRDLPRALRPLVDDGLLEP